MFGHEKGAFTGAHVQRKGRIETASGGTLFLDEIGEIPLPLQVKLLRFLQEQTIERVGGRQEIHINTRVVAATNADLKKAMPAGTFREDLFYRLAVVQMVLPPLRDRDNDVRLLAQFFLNRFAAQVNKPNLAFDQEAIRALNKHDWPGNVRELENCVRRAVIMAEGKRVTATDLELNSAGLGCQCRHLEGRARSGGAADGAAGVEKTRRQDRSRRRRTGLEPPDALRTDGKARHQQNLKRREPFRHITRCPAA